jgi:signal transduction histidine kinase
VKLLTRYNRANIITAIIVLVATSVTYYFIIRSILLQQLDKDLKVEEQEIYEYVKQHNALPNATAYKGQEIRFEVAKAGGVKRQLKTSTILNANNEKEPARILVFPVKVKGVLNQAVVIKSQAEAEGLLELIVVVTGSIILLMLVIISFVNRFLLGKLWQPFYSTLAALRTFDVKNAKALQLPETNVVEFDELNVSVSVMTKRISEEFESLKSFTDNASHEMQTPLAIINSKLDLLLQSSTEKQAEQLQAIYNATARLSKLNQTLLLLTKINNDQYKNHQQVDLEELLTKKLQQFEELVKARNIRVDVELQKASINMNEELAEILINNLLSNAIKHNFERGHINIRLDQKALCISNSGPSLTFNPKDIFKRFQKSSTSAGTGLGLAVVKQICENAGVEIEYKTNQNDHIFTIWLKALNA